LGEQTFEGVNFTNSPLLAESQGYYDGASNYITASSSAKLHSGISRVWKLP
jgi:hypothetical protein